LNLKFPIKTGIGLSAIGLVLSCAKQGFPPGGPEDKTPPAVIRTFPETGAVNVPVASAVEVWFSEAVKPGASGDAVFVSPYEGSNARAEWKGRRLRVRFRNPMRANCTYVVTLGASLQDYRNNRMDSSFTVAFSTGPALDQGRISGRVVATPGGAAVDVWAYRLDAGEPDPAARQPDYVVQAASNGDFRFLHVAPVRYRLFAVRDRAGNRLFEPAEDEIGMPSRDVGPSSGDRLEADSVFFRTSRLDAGSPSLQRVTPSDRNHLSVRFDRWLTARTPPSAASGLIVSDADPSDSLAVRALWLNRDNPREVFVVTADQADGKPYRFLLRTGWIAGPPDTAFWKAGFTGVGRPDTTRPRLTQASPGFRERAFNPLDPVRLTFDEAMDTCAIADGFSLRDTSGAAVTGRFLWTDPAEMRFVPGVALRNRTDYRLSMKGGGFRDACGNAAADTLIPFRTSTSDTLSEIAGTVRTSRPGTAGSAVITASPAAASAAPEAEAGRAEAGRAGSSGAGPAAAPGRYTVRASPSGAYRIRDCLPGAYRLECFLDLDGDGRYSAGRPFPFEPSEPFVVYRDTVKVRSRWPNEGNDLTVP
jgi:hypothetical protein